MLWCATQVLLSGLRQSDPQLLAILAADGPQMNCSFDIVLSQGVILLTQNDESMPRDEGSACFAPRQDRVPHRTDWETHVVTSLQYNSSFYPVLLPSLFYWYWIPGHSPVNFPQTNLHLRVSFWGTQYARVTSVFFLNRKILSNTQALCGYHIWDIKNPWVIYIWKAHWPYQ